MTHKKLRQEIREFRRTKIFFAIPLIIIGLVGLILPVIPGILLIVYGIMFLIPTLNKKMP
ncbi:hypothetical protein JXQ31_09910 [candidate division KSB1 bacterium]|nr:hypothetical protein [candidate division KSB1 bacterium]